MENKFIFLFFLTVIFTISEKVKAANQSDQKILISFDGCKSPLENSHDNGNGFFEGSIGYLFNQSNETSTTPLGIRILQKDTGIDIYPGNYSIQTFEKNGKKFLMPLSNSLEPQAGFRFTKEIQAIAYEFLLKLLKKDPEEKKLYSGAFIRINPEFPTTFCIIYASAKDENKINEVIFTSLFIKQRPDKAFFKIKSEPCALEKPTNPLKVKIKIPQYFKKLKKA